MKKVKAAPPKNSHTQYNEVDSNQHCKMASMLRQFAKGDKIQRFQAEKLGDHTLPATIYDLEKKYGLIFNRRWTMVPNRFNSNSRVMLYWLSGPNLTQAQCIVNGRAEL